MTQRGSAKPHTAQPPPETPALSTEDRRRISTAIERIEERLDRAPPGLHQAGEPAALPDLERSLLPEGAKLLWATFDGIDFAHGDAVLVPLAEQAMLTQELERSGLARPGDLAIGYRGRDVYVLPRDPYEEGAEVVLVEEGGERSPEASSVAHLALGLLAEFSALYDEQGEIQDDILGEDTELQVAAERRSLRRRLDADVDAPRPRYRLAQLLRRAGEVRAAASELRRTLRIAPEFAWARYELARTLLAQGETRQAIREFEAAAASVGSADEAELGTVAHFLAHAALAAEGDERQRLAAKVTGVAPDYAASNLGGARALVEEDRFDEADELLSLALAVAPRHVELLDLKRQVARLRAEAPPPDDAAGVGAQDDADEVPEALEVPDCEDAEGDRLEAE